jgi:DNA-binding MarR family transcriptional regulator
MQQIRNLHAAMRLCRRTHPQLRASQIELLLQVYLKPGMTQSELAEKVDLTLSAVSRAIDVLGKSGRRDGKSNAQMDWVEARRNPDDDRILQVFITQKGRDFVSTLEHLIYGNSICD